MIDSYLDYLDNPTYENIKLVHKASRMTQSQIAEMLKIGLNTYKGWHTIEGKKNHRKPSLQSWNLLLYELEARKIGYSSVHDFFIKHKKT